MKSEDRDWPHPSFLLDPNSVSWQLPRGSQFLMVEGHLRRGLGKLKAQCLPASPSIKYMSVLPSQRQCCYSPAKVTHSTGFCPSLPSKRLFPGGLISDPILFGAVFIFNYLQGGTIRIGLLPDCEISFPFLYTCDCNMRKKTRAQLMFQT